MKFDAMNEYRLEHDDLPDGAFFQLAEDMHGWTPKDWIWFSEQYEDEAREREDAGGFEG